MSGLRVQAIASSREPTALNRESENGEPTAPNVYMYRPEFAYETPEGSEDHSFEHFFDQHNVPALGTPLTSGQQLLDIPLRLDPDADFYWRAIKIEASSNNFFIRFRDPFGNQLSEYIPASNYVPSPTRAQAPAGSTPVPIEPEILCPAGSIVFVDIAVP